MEVEDIILWSEGVIPLHQNFTIMIYYDFLFAIGYAAWGICLARFFRLPRLAQILVGTAMAWVWWLWL